jgi:hypothetical protein
MAHKNKNNNSVQNTDMEKSTKRTQNIPNGHTIDQITVKHTEWP